MTYRIAYDSAKKEKVAPFGPDEQKAIPLQYNAKEEAVKVYVGGLAYCTVQNGQYWIIGCDESMGFQHTELLFLKKNEATGKWEQQPNEEKAFRTLYEENNYCYALMANGHKGLEAFVETLDGKFIDSDVTVETTEADKVSTALKALLSGEDPDLKGILSSIPLILTEEEFTSQKDRKGKLLPHPILADGKPVVLAHLPSIKVSGGKSWGGGKPGFLATADRIKEVLAFKEDSTFESLYQWYVTEPQKVSFALALTGVSISLSTVSSPTLGESSNAQIEDANAVLANFKLVVDKEKTEDATGYSDEALAALATPDTVDTYKLSLLELSKFTTNGKPFPFGATKQKLGLNGSLFRLTLAELKELAVRAEL